MSEQGQEPESESLFEIDASGLKKAVSGMLSTIGNHDFTAYPRGAKKALATVADGYQKSGVAAYPKRFTEEKIATGSFPEHIYDVGESGITGHFVQYQDAEKKSLECRAQAIGWIMLTLTMPIWYSDFIFISLALLFGLLSWWNHQSSRAYKDAWDALESHGPVWHFENGTYYRVMYIRKDGSGSIDRRSRDKRIEEEVRSYRERAKTVFQSRNGIRAGKIGTAVVFAGLCLLLLLCGASDSLWWHIPWVAGVVTLWASIPSNLVSLHLAQETQAAYEANKQYIPGPRVFDPIQPPLSMEEVKKRAVFGDAGFADPGSASDRLRS